jgi:hypothetical protein
MNMPPMHAISTCRDKPGLGLLPFPDQRSSKAAELGRNIPEGFRARKEEPGREARLFSVGEQSMKIKSGRQVLHSLC